MDVTRMCQGSDAGAWGALYDVLEDGALEDASALMTSLQFAAGWACPASGAARACDGVDVPYHALSGWAAQAKRVVSFLYDLQEVADARSRGGDAA